MMGCSLSMLDAGSRPDVLERDAPPNSVALVVGCEKGSKGVGMDVLSEIEEDGIASSMRAQVR